MPEVEIDAPMPLPEGVREVADRADSARADVIESVTPEGDFSVDGINDVIDEINAVLPKFGMEPIEAVSTSDGMLPTEVTQALMMVAQAAQDARIMDLTEDLDALADDQDLLILAGKLKSLAGSSDFDRFLATEAPRIAESAAPEEALDEPLPAAPPTSGGGLPSDDELFAARI
jgi:hypothetical protein